MTKYKRYYTFIWQNSETKRNYMSVIKASDSYSAFRKFAKKGVKNVSRLRIEVSD